MRSMTALCLLFFITTACETRPHDDLHKAAILFTDRYSQSRLSKWNVRASTAGDGCDVLLVHTSIVLEDSLVEAMHYGAGAYGVFEGGVNSFYRQRSFRGVAYKDPTGRVWTFGALTLSEASDLRACR